MERERQPTDEILFLEQPPVRGVSKQLVFDLYDISSKFSSVDPEAGIAVFNAGDLGDEISLSISRSINPTNNTLMVSDGKTPKMGQGMQLIRTNRGTIMWDGVLTAHEAKIAIAKIDSLALQSHLIDEKNGERKYLPAEIRFTKLRKHSVSKAFETPGAVFAVLPGQNPVELLTQFDEPERLEIIDTPGGKGIILKDESNKKLVQENERVAMDLLKERGITMEMIGNLSFEEIMELRKEIEKRMSEVKNQNNPEEN